MSGMSARANWSMKSASAPGATTYTPSAAAPGRGFARPARSEEHTSELQSPCNIVCRLLLEKKKHFSSSSLPPTYVNVVPTAPRRHALGAFLLPLHPIQRRPLLPHHYLNGRPARHVHVAHLP